MKNELRKENSVGDMNGIDNKGFRAEVNGEETNNRQDF